MKRPKDGLTIEGDEVMGSVTRGYVDFMIATGATGSFLEGLVLLWATEKVRRFSIIHFHLIYHFVVLSRRLDLRPVSNTLQYHHEQSIGSVH